MALRHRVAGHVLRAYWRLRRPRTFGVRAVVTDSAGRIALVRHSYLPGWYLPGGGVDKREGADAAIRRELREEVALDVAITGLVGVYHNLAQGKDDHVVVYAARIPDPAALRAADPREIVEAAWFAPDALPADTSPATRRRIADALAGGGVSGAW